MLPIDYVYDEVRVLAPTTRIMSASCSAYTTDSAAKPNSPAPCAMTGAAVFTPGRERAAMTVKIAVPEDGIAGTGPEYDGAPLPRSTRILLIAVGAVLLLVLVGLITRLVLGRR